MSDENIYQFVSSDGRSRHTISLNADGGLDGNLRKADAGGLKCEKRYRNAIRAICRTDLASGDDKLKLNQIYGALAFTEDEEVEEDEEQMDENEEPMIIMDDSMDIDVFYDEEVGGRKRRSDTVSERQQKISRSRFDMDIDG
ncbi:unnamed protein product [Caenorhabditis sp. 36 PRJEB53466]|nr:unnamed protein product [Caenorhabditis sp. 36 PRJEB53466]